MNCAAERRVLVIGYGNPLRQDDGVGVRAAEALEAVLAAPPTAAGTPALAERVSILTLPQLTPELADAVAEADLVIFIDACCDRPAGSILRQELVPGPAVVGALDHHLHPATLLGLAQLVFGHCPRAVVFTVGGAAFDFDDTLSPPVAAALPEVVRQVRELAGI